jgi:hypothetical protein
MESNNAQKDLQNFGKAAADAIAGLGGALESAKKNLTPEQQADIDKQLQNIDLKEAMSKLAESTDLLANLHKQV